MGGFQEPDVPEHGELLNCMHCGLCLPTCPTYQLTGRERSSPRGRLSLMLNVLDGNLQLDEKAFAEEMSYCLGCLACETACPAGVKYGHLLEQSRDQVARLQPRWKRALQDVAFRLFEQLALLRGAARLLILYQRSGLQWLVRKSGLLKLIHMERKEAMLPPLDPTFSSQRLPAVRGTGKRVGMLVGCVMDFLFARENLATARVLEHNGCQVHCPKKQGCCGALHAHAGRMEKARQLARHNIAVFEELELEAVVVNSAGCSNAMKHYGALLHDDPLWRERAERFAASVQDVHEFLVALPYQKPDKPLPLQVTYHDACHLAHGQGIRSQPRQVMDSLAQERHECPQADQCCGSAGTYNLVHFETSMQLLEQKIDAILSTGAQVVGVANPGCLLQIRFGLQQRGSAVRAEHPVVLLDEAYRLNAAQPSL